MAITILVICMMALIASLLFYNEYLHKQDSRIILPIEQRIEENGVALNVKVIFYPTNGDIYNGEKVMCMVLGSAQSSNDTVNLTTAQLGVYIYNAYYLEPSVDSNGLTSHYGYFNAAGEDALWASSRNVIFQASGQCPIYVRLIVNGTTHIEHKLNVDVNVEPWSEKAQLDATRYNVLVASISVPTGIFLSAIAIVISIAPVEEKRRERRDNHDRVAFRRKEIMRKKR